jgi:hypothetical protein
MFGKSAFVIAVASALVVPVINGCQASFHAGSEPAAAPTPTPRRRPRPLRRLPRRPQRLRRRPPRAPARPQWSSR